MVDPSEPIDITPEDVNEFAQKLDYWSNQLPPKERAVLAAMLAQTSSLVPVDEEEPLPPLVRFKVPLESIVGRFIVERREESAMYIKESGPTWVNSPHIGDWGEVVLPE
ncbi:hypothetical protein [Nocardia suismassiliense]|uniref:hypothetical protein n=1 Tax=Nocardia suismassiliense TaxID=2077092 RepID=UPI000D1EBA4F|nr:hypothetical protein [Nocardia suismassiliense]